MAPESTSNKRAAAGGTVSFTKRIDKSSPLLAKSQNSGDEIGEMALAENGKQFLLKNVKVVSIQKKGQQEVVKLRFKHREQFGQVQKSAANHNTTRSNRLAPAKATDYNTSRSNKNG
jgi:type VI protein secretion system component Hcp